MQSPTSLPIQSVYTIALAIKAPTPLPDHYTGDVQLRVTGGTSGDPLLKIPLDVNVRTGPVWPISVLVIGSLLGRLVKYMKDKGGPQSDLLLHLYQLEGRMAASPADQELLRPMVESVKAWIYELKLDAAKSEIAAIENRWVLLGTLTANAGAANVQGVLNDIERARILIASKRDQDASALVTEIEAAVQHVVAPPPPPAAFALASAQAGTARAVAARVARSIAAPPTPWYVRALSRITGISEAVRAEVTLWLIRPIMYLLLVGLLLLVGMQRLYLKNPLFGSDPFSDYFGIVVWAMSSDVASRTLTTLKPSA